jgi:hypothetical protein
MIWKKIEKDPSKQPTKGMYSDWKQLLADEGHNQCVYCALHESIMGGIRNFHVEHYRPKSKWPEKLNTYTNLFYACPICNTYKSNDWPNEPNCDHSVASYPDPSVVDYNSLFDIDSRDGLINGKYIATKYIQEKLFLNRPQLVIARKINYLNSIGMSQLEEISKVLGELSDEDYRYYSEIFNKLSLDFIKLILQLREIPNYRLDDTKRLT